MISTIQKNKGFTIIEAIVSLAIFAIAFSGLYFFFGMAHQAYNNSEKRMHLNLMANHILDTIHAEAYRSDADVANPFVTPASYNANLSDCSTYTAPDVRHTWCTELDASVGPHKGVHADEVRTVEVVKDEAYLIANVTLVVDAGIGEKNLIKTFLSRKIAPARVDPPSIACIERHNTLVNFIKKHKADCKSGAQGQFSTYLYQTFYGVKKQVAWRTKCMNYGGKTYYTGLPSGVGFSYRKEGYIYSQHNSFNYYQWPYYMNMLARQFNEYLKWQIDDDITTPGTIYGSEYSWNRLGEDGFESFIFGLPIYMGGVRGDPMEAVPGTIVSTWDLGLSREQWADLKTAQPKVKSTHDVKKADVTIVSCCPTEKKSNGKWKPCGLDHKSNADHVPFLAETIDFYL